jgi:hypothetical protein
MTVAGQRKTALDDPCGSPERSDGSNPETPQRESVASAVHELSERLTAATNYVAAALRLFELTTTEKGGCSETLQKALAQLDCAGDTVRSLRKSMQEHRQ